MRFAQIRKMDISNGEGIGMSLFVQGCHFHCKGCFNKETWDFSGGHEWTDEAERQFFNLMERPYIKRVSFLGGEPLADENVEKILELITQINLRHPEKKIWLYTGYSWEQIMNHSSTPEDKFRSLCIHFVDYVVDGPFQIENQDIAHKDIVWAGSTNQRVIDVKGTLRTEKIVQM